MLVELPDRQVFILQGTGGEIVVCKNAFASIFGLSISRIRRLCEWMSSGQVTTPVDKRGEHENHHKMIPEQIHKQVCDHVESFPPQESRY